MDSSSPSNRYPAQQQCQRFFQPTPPYSPSDCAFSYPSTNDSPMESYNSPQWPGSTSSSWSMPGFAPTSPTSSITPPLLVKTSLSPSLTNVTPLSRYVEIKPKPADPAQASALQSQQPRSPKQEAEDSVSSTTDFVKKLYKILEDELFPDICTWNARGDCIIIKDVGEFSKVILPRMFKHSNFASFVRQLNKYDFHKVKNADDNQFGEQSWTFRHLDFHRNRRDALDNIKRKLPTHRASRHSPSPSSDQSPLLAMQAQLERMTQQQEEMTAHIRSLETEYENVLGEMVAFQKTLAQQDELMRNMVQVCFSCNDSKNGMLRL